MVMCNCLFNVLHSFPFWFSQDAFKKSIKECNEVFKKANSEFKSYKTKKDSLEKELRRQKQKVENLIKNSRPQARIDEEIAKQRILDEQFATQQEGKWMLDLRDLIHNPEKMKESKYHYTIKTHSFVQDKKDVRRFFYTNRNLHSKKCADFFFYNYFAEKLLCTLFCANMQFPFLSLSSLCKALKTQHVLWPLEISWTSINILLMKYIKIW